MENDIKKIIMSKKEIDGICERLGSDISRDYAGKHPIVIGLLKGCEPFMSDLLGYVTCYARKEYMKVSSYSGKESGTVIIKQDITLDIAGEDIILVDDIVDTGKTVYEISKVLKARHAHSVEICCLLNKPEGRLVDVNVKYVGGRVPNEFVVGYGLDYEELYRNLPYIGVLKEEVYSD